MLTKSGVLVNRAGSVVVLPITFIFDKFLAIAKFAATVVDAFFILCSFGIGIIRHIRAEIICKSEKKTLS